MATLYENRIFEDVYDDEGITFEDLSFVKCTFSHVVLSRSVVRDRTKRTTVRNVSLKNCTFDRGVGVGCVLFDGVTVDGLRILERDYELVSSAFRHVTLKGRIGAL